MSSGELEALATALLQEIEARWAGQARGWGKDKQKAAAWARGIKEAGAPAPVLLRLALARVTSRAYPPDLGLLLAVALEPIGEEDARKSMARAVDAAAHTPPLWHLLTPLEFAAVSKYGGAWELRNAPAGGWERWGRLLNQLAREGGDFPSPPPPPSGLLASRPTDEEKARVRAQLANIKKMLG